MTESGEAASEWPAARKAWYVAFVLMLANTLAFIDRQALALLVEPIKNDLQVSDTAMSLLYGLSFTLFYVIIGIPVARLADQSNRRNIVSVAILVWSVATSVCGLARTFTTLFVARIIVGAGEGGLTPSAHSILSDYFPRQRLAAAMGVYQMGIYFGGAAALLIGGLISTTVPPTSSIALPLLGDVKGWQLIFLVLGLPGILIAALMLTVSEPKRHGVLATEKSAPLSQFFAHVGKHKAAYFGIGIGFGLMILVGNGVQVWIPAFFERKFGWTTAEIGATYGLVFFLCGTSGTLAGGFFATFLGRRGVPHANLFAAMIGFIVLIPLTIGFPMMPTGASTLAVIGMMNFFAGFNFGGGLAALQDLTPNRMRALIAAGYMLTINLLGAAGGPTVIALITDYVFHDPQRLPEAISLTCAIASPLSVVALWVGMRGYRRALNDRAAQPQLATCSIA